MLQAPAGSKPRFLIGNIPLASRDPLAVFRRWAQDYGDIFTTAPDGSMCIF